MVSLFTTAVRGSKLEGGVRFVRLLTPVGSA
jgi:hypothetical protein